MPVATRFCFASRGPPRPSRPSPVSALMKAVMYVDRDGNITDISTTSVIPEELAGISIELTFDDGTFGRFLVGFNNNQDVEQITLVSSP